MNWRRERPGVYTAGPYRIERLVSRWVAQGPGIAETHEHKVDAQVECEDAALERIVGNESTVMPVVGDAVMVGDRPGRVTTQLASADGTALLYCILFARKRRLCLRRHEFKVVLP